MQSFCLLIPPFFFSFSFSLSSFCFVTPPPPTSACFSSTTAGIITNSAIPYSTLFLSSLSVSFEMANNRNELEFQLPSEFLTDEDILMDNSFRAAGGRFRFPSAHGGSVLSSPVESVTGSTETESDEEYYTILSELTRPDAQKLAPACPTLDKNMLQSKLSGVGSWSGRSSVSSKGSPIGASHLASSPTTPLGSNNNRWDLIYNAVGLVDGAGESPSVINPTVFERQRSFPMHTPPKSSTHSFVHPNDLVRIEELFGQQECRMQSRHVRYTPNGCNLDRNNAGRILSSGDLAVQHGGAFFNGQFGIKNHHPQLVAAGANGGGLLPGGGYGAAAHGSGVGGMMKSQRVGTGVFLPRKYGDNSTSNTPNLHKKSGYSSAFSTKKDLNLVNTNKKLSNTIGFVEFKTQNPHGNSMADYDALLEQRAYMLTLQKTKRFPEVAINHELCLPQEWTY